MYYRKYVFKFGHSSSPERYLDWEGGQVPRTKVKLYCSETNFSIFTCIKTLYDDSKHFHSSVCIVLVCFCSLSNIHTEFRTFNVILT